MVTGVQHYFLGHGPLITRFRASDIYHFIGVRIGTSPMQGDFHPRYGRTVAVIVSNFHNLVVIP